MSRFFERRDPWGHGWALWVLLAMVFLCPIAWWSLRQIDLENDVENWLPADDPPARVLAWYRRHFPAEDRLFVSWEGSTLGDPRAERLARRLEGTRDERDVRRGGLRQVEDVITPNSVIARMAASVRRDRLQAVGPAEAGHYERGAPRSQAIPRSQAQLGNEALHRLTGTLIGPGGSPIALLVTLSEAGSADRRGTLEAIRRAAEEAGIPREKLHLGGRSVAAASLNAEVKKAAWNREQPLWRLHKRSPLLLSALAGLVLAFVMLRSFRLTTLVLIGANYAALLTVALVPVTGGSMNMVLVVMPTLLSVLTLSAAIHLANYWKHAVAGRQVSGGRCQESGEATDNRQRTTASIATPLTTHHSPLTTNHSPLTTHQSAIVEAVRMARTPCLLASATTAIGLASLATSPLKPVRDFGLYSAAGCFISLAVVLYALPALMQFWPPRSRKSGSQESGVRGQRSELGTTGHRQRTTDQSTIDNRQWSIATPLTNPWHRLGGLLAKYRLPVAVAATALLFCGGWGLTRFRTETKVIRYFPQDSRLIEDYRFLENRLAGIIPVETVVRFDRDSQQRLNLLQRAALIRRIEDRMRQHPEISGAISLADFIPDVEPPPADAALPRRLMYHRRISDAEERLKNGGSRARALLATADADVSLPAGEARTFEALEGDELWRITAQASVLSDADYGTLSRELDEIVQTTLTAGLYPEPAADRGTDVAASAPSASTRCDHLITGMVPVFLRTQQAVLDSLITSFALAFAVIAVVMIVLLRDPLAGCLSMLPNLLPVVTVFGAISWLGLAVDIGTMLTASIALGIAVDGTLHLLTWFRDGLAAGLSRRDALCRALTSCGPAIFQTSCAVGLALSMLAFADLLLIQRFGWMMAALIGTALLADAVFLPALLAGPLGTLIERRIAGHRFREEDADQNADPPLPHMLTPGVESHGHRRRAAG